MKTLTYLFAALLGLATAEAQIYVGGGGGGSGGSGGLSAGTNAIGTMRMNTTNGNSIAFPAAGVYTNLSGYATDTSKLGLGADTTTGTLIATNEGYYYFISSLGGTTGAGNKVLQFTFFTNDFTAGFGNYTSNNNQNHLFHNNVFR